MGHTAGLYNLEMRKTFFLSRDSNPYSPAPSLAIARNNKLSKIVFTLHRYRSKKETPGLDIAQNHENTHRNCVYKHTYGLYRNAVSPVVLLGRETCWFSLGFGQDDKNSRNISQCLGHTGLSV
jgi:hypothetical protein